MNCEDLTPFPHIVRRGTISLINTDKTFYIDGSAFPGNSGSPVFIKPSVLRYDGKHAHFGGENIGGRFIGIVGEYITYKEIAVSIQTERPRVIFEENTGLSKVWSATFLTDIIKSPDFQKQLNQLTKSRPLK